MPRSWCDFGRRHRRASLATVVVATALTLFVAAAPVAHAQVVVYDNGPIVGDQTGYNFTDIAVADDFAAASPLTFDAIRFYVLTTPGGLVPNFSGTVSWFVHADSGGAIPNSLPSPVILASGSSSSVTLTPTAITGIGQMDFALPTPVTLPAGRYWLRLKDGLPSAVGDGTPTFWVGTGGPITGNVFRRDFDEVNPTTWSFNGTTDDSAFQLINTQGVAPEPGSLALLSLAALPIVALVRRRGNDSRNR